MPELFSESATTIKIIAEIGGNHGGDLALLKSDAEGTIFRVTLPEATASTVH